MNFKSLSNNASVESILADVPFLAVGLLAFGTLTFFLIMRALNRWVLLLHLSVLLGFIASILDLSDVLVHGAPSEKMLASFHLGGFGTVREVLLALATGTLFLFLWGLVGLPPPTERALHPDGMHSGRWERWGITGILLKWSLAAAYVVMIVLQMLYRIVPSFHSPGPVYHVECTIRVIVSAVLVLKILLNTYLATFASKIALPRWKTLRDYSAVVIAVLIQLGLAVGDIIHFMLSSNVLGKFLEAISFYILLVYILVTSFYHLRGMRRPVAREKADVNRSSSFRGLGPLSERESFFRISPMRPPRSSDPDFLSMGGNDGSDRTSDPQQPQSGVEKARRPSHINLSGGSTASRVSAWLPRRSLLPSFSSASSPEPDNERLWNQDEAEKGMSPLKQNGSQQEIDTKGPRESLESPMEPKESAKWQDPMFTNVLSDSPENIESQLPSADRVSDPPAPPTLTIPPRAAFARSETPLTDSPIYGLGGIVRAVLPPEPDATSLSSRTESPAAHRDDSPASLGVDSPDNSRITSISYLFREQAELDKTIANLKMLSSSSPHPPSSTPSDFSLSNFPTPPWSRGSVVSETDTPVIAPGIQAVIENANPGSGKSQETSDTSAAPDVLAPPTMPAAVTDHNRTASVPYSDDGLSDLAEARGGRMDSLGTQYEITSFIGNLTQPGRSNTGSATSTPAGSMSNSPPKQATLDGEPVQLPNTSPPSAFSAAVRPGVRTVPAPIRGGSVPFITRPVVGLPPRPRLATRSISSPLALRMSPTDEYERPRPAPSPKEGSGAPSP